MFAKREAAPFARETGFQAFTAAVELVDQFAARERFVQEVAGKG